YNADAQFTRYTVVADEMFREFAQDAPGSSHADLTENRQFAELVDAQDGDFLAACRADTAAPIPVTAVLPVMRLASELADAISDDIAGDLSDDLADDLARQIPEAAPE